MARRKKPEDEENHDRWLISYADFITLLFAFFVVMYATSSVNERKYRILGESITNAFGNQPEVAKKPVEKPVEPPPPQPDKEKREQMQEMAKEVMSSLEAQMKEGKVRVTQSGKGIVIDMDASMLFSAGRASVQPAAAKALASVAQILKDDSRDILVEGHTDNSEIDTYDYPSNWELSSARASAVVRILVQNGIYPQRLAAIGYGEYRPVESNGSAEGRARNRRVAITILNNQPGLPSPRN